MGRWTLLVSLVLGSVTLIFSAVALGTDEGDQNPRRARKAALPMAARKAAARQLIAVATKDASIVKKAEEKAWIYAAIGSVHARLGEMAAARKDLKTACEAAAQIANEALQAKVFSGMIVAQAKAGDRVGAGAISEAAQASIAKLPAVTAAYDLSEIARAQAKSGDMAGAKATAAHIGNARPAFQAYYWIASEELYTGNVSGARQTIGAAKSAAATIENENSRWACYSIVAAIQAYAGDAAGAMTTAKEISDQFEAGRALGQIAEAQAKRGDTAGAAATASRMKDTDGWYKVSAYEKIAGAQAKAGDAVGARKSLEAAKVVAASAPRESDKAAHLHSVAENQAEVGDMSGAKATAAQISDKYEQSLAYSGIATKQAKAGDRAGARQTFELAKTSGAQVTEKGIIGDAFRSVARGQAVAGEIDAARETAAKIKDEGDHLRAYYDIVDAQLRARDIAGAKATAALSGEKSSIWLGIMSAQAKRGDVKGAIVTAAEVTDAAEKESALDIIAVAQAKAGNLRDAKATAQRMSEHYWKDWVCHEIVAAQATTGGVGGAIDFCNHAITDPAARCRALTNAAEELLAAP
jgi:hypothetical protein